MAKTNDMFSVKAVTVRGETRHYREVAAGLANNGEKGPSVKIILHMCSRAWSSWPSRSRRRTRRPPASSTARLGRAASGPPSSVAQPRCRATSIAGGATPLGETTCRSR